MPRSILGRAQLLVVALIMVIAAAILDAYAHAHRFTLVQDALDVQLDGVLIALPQDTADRANSYVTAALIGSSIALVVAAVAWVMWQVRAAQLARGRIDGWRGDPRTGALVWFAPLVNLVAPPLVVAALMRAWSRPAPLLIGAWWFTWLASTVLAPFGTRRPEALADQRLPDVLAIASDVFLVAAGLLAIGVVRRITDAALGEEDAALLAADQEDPGGDGQAASA